MTNKIILVSITMTLQMVVPSVDIGGILKLPEFSKGTLLNIMLLTCQTVDSRYVYPLVEATSWLLHNQHY